MERCLMIGGALLTLVAFVAAFFFFFKAAWHFIKMLSHFRNRSTNLIVNLVPFMFLCMPNLFTAQGNFHRKKHLSNLVWFLCCFAFIATMISVLNKG